MKNDNETKNEFEQFLKQYIDTTRPESNEERRQKLILNKLDILSSLTNKVDKIHQFLNTNHNSISLLSKEKEYLRISPKGIEYPQSKTYKFKQWLKKFLAIE